MTAELMAAARGCSLRDGGAAAAAACRRRPLEIGTNGRGRGGGGGKSSDDMAHELLGGSRSTSTSSTSTGSRNTSTSTSSTSTSSRSTSSSLCGRCWFSKGCLVLAISSLHAPALVGLLQLLVLGSSGGREGAPVAELHCCRGVNAFTLRIKSPARRSRCGSTASGG